MKKYLTVIATAILTASFSSYAGTSTTIQDYFYQKGKEEGYKQGFKEGYLKAYYDIKKSLEKYKNEIRAMEIGKYLYDNQKITPPRVYRVKEGDGKFSVVVKGCEIENIKTIDEIITKGIELPTIVAEDVSKEDLVTGNYISKLDSYIPDVKTDMGSVYIYVFKKSRKVKEALDKFNIPYEESDSEFKAIFEDADALASFCDATKLCEGLK